MADFQKIKAMSRKEREELFLNFDILFTKVNMLFCYTKGEEHKAYSRVLDLISDIAIKRELEPCRVKIVKCKDCKHFLFDTEYCKEHNRGYCEFDNTIKTRNHFCSYGERKDG